MATGYAEADRLSDNVDWSVSHRAPPVPISPPVGSAYTASAGAVFKVPADNHSGERYQHSEQQPNQRVNQATASAPATRERGPWAANSDEAASTISAEGRSHSLSQTQSNQGGSGRRRGSFSFLRRTTSNTSQQGTRSRSNSNAGATYIADASAPPLPNTLISQLHAEAAARQHRPRTSSSSWREGTMLRKSSRMRKEAAAEQERQAREAAIDRLPHHLEPLNPLPGPIATFGGDDARPDSIAIFNNAYTHSSNSSVPRTTANFSRPAAMAPSSNTNSSSSPAYRTGNGLPHSSSPPDVRVPKSNGEYVSDPASSDRTESMTHRGRYSYASSTGNVNTVNSPRRVRRRKDPTPFNVLIIGAKNSGKSSFISFLRHSLALPSHKQSSGQKPAPQIGGNRSSFTSDYLETEIDSERVGLTLWDSAGLEKNIVDLQLREMAAFVEAKFEDTFVEEQKVMRSPGVKDTHIHCVFLILDPVRLDTTIADSAAFHTNGSHAGSLDDDLDLQVMRALWGKTTVIPVISKADTLTVGHMAFLKRAVSEALKGAKLDPLEALELEEDASDEDDEEENRVNGYDNSSDEGDELPVPKVRPSHKRHSSLSAAGMRVDEDDLPYLPMSIISPDMYDLPPYVPKSKAGRPDKVGRKFPWGFADPYDADHCDFGRLRDSIFSEWRSELRELSRSKWYENWRTSRLKNLPGSRQRVKGGVTPVAAVPREGRIASHQTRQFSPATAPSASSITAASSVPRSVSGASISTSNATPSVGMAVTHDAKARNASGSSQTGSVRAGTYRSIDSFK